MTGHHDEHGRPSDSAGQAWAGKSIPDPGFSGDTGEADPQLVAALTDLATHGPGDAREQAWAASMSTARFLVPIVAIATEVAGDGAQRHDTRSDMAVVTLTLPDGTRALPVFSSTATLAAWDAAARPAPTSAAHAAQSAIAEECHVLLVDLGSPHQRVVPSSMLWALAQQQTWLPAHLDPHVRHAVHRAVADEPEIRGHRLERGTDGGLHVVLAVVPGLSATVIGDLATRVGERIATDGETRARIDALSFALETAT